MEDIARHVPLSSIRRPAWDAEQLSGLGVKCSLDEKILAFVCLKQKYEKKEPFLQMAMLIGLYLLCAKGGLGQFGLGEVLTLIAATLVAGSLVFGKSALQHISAKMLSFVQTVLALFFCGVLCTGRNVEPGRHCGRGDYHVVRTVGKYSIVSTVFSINTLV